MRKKKALVNAVFSILLEIMTIISGFIIPRLIIGTFGSEVNGLTNSIASFIGYITLLQSGVGSVAKHALFKPLADKNHEQLSIIVNTVERFFRKIAGLTILYILLLAVLFPTLITPKYDFLYTASLVVIIGISTAAQYFFGITNQMLLEADQRSFVFSGIQILTLLLNTIVVVILVRAKCSIQIVKLASSVFFVLRPVVLNYYTRTHYRLKRQTRIDNGLIKQRWDGFIQAIAYFIHSKTDVMVLTLMSTLSNVSIYSVYAMVTLALTSFLKAIDKAVNASFGNIIACNENDHLQRTFSLYNTFTHIVSTIAFSTASITIFSFIEVYVKNVSDAEYVQRTFGIIIISAEYLYCLRLPYNSVIYAAGKFRETRISAAIEAGLNILISVIMVHRFGLVGVAIGTAVAMSYRTVSFVVYLHKEVLKLNFLIQIKRYLVSFLSYTISIVTLSSIKVVTNGYFQWGIYALAVLIGSTMIVLCLNLMFLREDTVTVIKTLVKRRSNS